MLLYESARRRRGIATWTKRGVRRLYAAVLGVFDTAPRDPGINTSRFRLDRACAPALLVAFWRRLRVLRPRGMKRPSLRNCHDVLFVVSACLCATLFHLHGGDFDRFVMVLPRALHRWWLRCDVRIVPSITEDTERSVASRLGPSSCAAELHSTRDVRGVGGNESARPTEPTALFVGAGRG